jgi:glycosyltransferase involved in cell wall biosynthesis
MLREGDSLVYARVEHVGFAPYLAARRRRRPLVAEFNGFAEVTRKGAVHADQVRAQGRLKTHAAVLAARLMHGFYLRCAQAVVVNNPEARDYFVNDKGVAPSRVHVIPLGYDPEVARPRSKQQCRAQLGLASDEPMIVHVGSLYHYKGCDTLIKAFARLAADRATLVFVGDGDARPQLEKLAAEAGVGGRVRFVGERPFDETPWWIGAADVAVGLHTLDPRWACCPTKVIEYVACGVPVVAKSMAITRQLAKAVPMRLVEDSKNVEEIARALDGFLSANCDALRVRHLPGAVTEYAWPEIGRRAADALSTLVEDTPATESQVALRSNVWNLW